MLKKLMCTPWIKTQLEKKGVFLVFTKPFSDEEVLRQALDVVKKEQLSDQVAQAFIKGLWS